MSASEIDTKVSAAAAAIEEGDYGTAVAKLRAAAVLMAGLPDTGSAGNSLTWSRQQVIDMLGRAEQLQALQATKGPLQSTKVKYVNPSD